MGPIPDTVFALSTMLIAIPTGVKIFNWLATMWGGKIRFTTSMLFAISLVFLFTIGGISGVMHSSPPADTQQSDTYFIVAHFHYVLFGGSMMGIFAGVYFYFPKMTGRMLNEGLGKVHFWATFVAMNLTFMPMHWAGMLGMPRRVYRYDAGQGFDAFNAMSSFGSYLLGAATLVFVFNLLKSRKSGAIAGNDPWGGATLEWELPSPPPDYNFATLPHVDSRHPLWDAKAGKHSDEYRANALAPTRSAKALGIPMPIPTIKPLLTAVAIIVFFVGLIMRSHAVGQAFAPQPVSTLPSLIIMLLGGLLTALTLFWWLFSPLEEEN
jgi:cytochrome c oxidase subunit 1